MRTFRLIAFFALATASLVAAPVYLVTLPTASLIGDPLAPFSLDFQFTDGSTLGNGNNTIILSAFSFGGGSAAGAPTLVGGAAGSLGAGVTLTDTAFLNSLTQGFNPGAFLSFFVNATNNSEVPVPDLLTFAILDKDGFEVSTDSFFDVFFELELGGPTPQAYTYTGEAGGPMAGAGASAVVVPEPGSLVLAAAGLLAVAALRRRR